MATNIHRVSFPSISAAIASVDAGDHTAYIDGTKDSEDWYGEPWADTRKGSTMGGVGKYGEMVQDWLGTMPAATLRPSKWETGAAGYLPNVPAYLAGSPRHMQRRTKAPTLAPVKIYVGSVHSGGCDAGDIAKRGAAILSMVERVRATGRPVDLAFIASMSYNGQTACIEVRSNAQQMNPDALAFAMCSPAFGRRLMFTIGHNATKVDDWGIGWGWKIAGGSTNPDYRNRERETYGITDGDIYVPGLHLREAEKIKADPAAWVQEHLDRAGIES